jgi:hypothetical protein
LDFGEVENNWLNRFDLVVADLFEMPPFSLDVEKDGEFVEEELLAKGFVGRRGISGFTTKALECESFNGLPAI